MLGLDIRSQRQKVQTWLQRMLSWAFWQTLITERLEHTTRAITGGLSTSELGALLRGAAPTEKPNPRYRLHTKSFWFHIRPRYYQRGSTWFTHTWRLGWFSTFFFMVETITGLILMIFYTPSPLVAYGNMLNILSNVPFGKFMRDLHRLGAEGMVIAVTLHMLRVYLTGSYKNPRQFTWLTGVVLLLVTLFLSFSGYLLPWDQLAYWAVTIGTSMAEAAPVLGTRVNLLLRGSPDIAANGLLRFYLLHVFLLPLLGFVFLMVHYYKVSREHGISLPAAIEEGDVPVDVRRRGEERVDFIPDLLTHEILLLALGTFIMVAAVAFFFQAPLESHANPLRTPLHTQAPWYFLWIQGMLKIGDKVLMGIILPTVIFGLLFAVPYIDEFWDWLWKRKSSRLGKNRRLGISLALVFIVIMVVLTLMGSPTWGIVTPPGQEIAQEFSPEEGEGPMQRIPFDQYPVGYFDTRTWTYPTDRPPTEFDKTFAEFKARVEAEIRHNQAWKKGEELAKEKGLDPTYGAWTISEWQQDLKQIRVTIDWNEFDPTTEQLLPDEKSIFTDKTVYIHRKFGD